MNPIDLKWELVCSKVSKLSLKSENEATALCPSHQDSNPSLSLKRKKDRILLKCFAGCSFPEIVSALGMVKRDFCHSSHLKTKQKSKEVCRYDYRDKNNSRVCSVVRLAPKDFRRLRHEKGREVWNWKGVTPPPYRLPELVNAISERETVFFVEGEKDVESLMKIGITASTLAGGIGGWDSYDLKDYFNSADLVLIPDNDDAGREGMAKFGERVSRHAKRLRWLELPDLKKKGDVSDWLDLNNASADDFLSLVSRSAKDWPEVFSQMGSSEGVPANHRVDSAIEELNRGHFFCMQEGRAVIVNVKDYEENKGNLSFSSTTDFKHLYANKKVFYDGKETSIASIWIQHPKRRQHDKIVFMPDSEQIVDGNYNLWRGFAFKPKEFDLGLPLAETKFSGFDDHIYNNIAQKNEEVYSYLWDWMADAVQNTARKPETSVVLKSSAQGTGKGTFIQIFGKLFGSHFLQIDSPHHLTGRFNTHLMNNLILFADEAFWAGDKASEGALKTLVSEEFRMIEPKGKDAFRLKNFTRLMVASNKSWVVPTEVEDRRFAIFEVSDKRKGDLDYFGRIWDEMKSGGYEELLFYLQNKEVLNDLRRIPNTTARSESKLYSLTSTQKWWHERLEDQHVLEDCSWDQFCSKKEIFEDFCVSHNQRGHMGRETFFKELYPLLPERPAEKQISRIRGLIFPPYERCRSYFESKFDISIESEFEGNPV